MFPTSRLAAFGNSPDENALLQVRQEQRLIHRHRCRSLCRLHADAECQSVVYKSLVSSVVIRSKIGLDYQYQSD